VTATAGASPSGSAGVTITNPSVVNRAIFYNNSKYDGNDPSANTTGDAAAIAPDKQALLPGQTATNANFTNYAAGINGVIIDIAALPASTLTASDFIFKAGITADPGGWSAAPVPASITVFAGAGVNGSDRVEIIWTDNTIRNQWLQITVNANLNTGLTSADVFFFGNLNGETGNTTPSAAAAVVDATDISAVRAQNMRVQGIASWLDFDRSGVSNIIDLANAKGNNGQSLLMITAPPPPPAAMAVSRAKNHPRRGALSNPSLAAGVDDRNQRQSLRLASSEPHV